MSLYTHWVCFECRKSSHNLPVPDSEKRKNRRCPDCGEQMRDMGIYFEAPRKQARKAWAILRLLAENGYIFQTEGSKSYIEHFILAVGKLRIQNVIGLAAKRPRIQDVIKRIEQEKKLTNKLKEKNRLDDYKCEKRIHKKRGSTNQ